MVYSSYASVGGMQRYPYPVAFLPMLDTRTRQVENIFYDDKKNVLRAGAKEIRIPNGTLEQCFCRVLFSRFPQESVSWDVIAEEMDLRHESQEDIRLAKQRIKDVKRRLNAKLAMSFGVEDYFRSENSEYYR